MKNKKHTPALGWRDMQDLKNQYDLDPQMVIGAMLLLFLAGCAIGLMVLVAISYS